MWKPADGRSAGRPIACLVLCLAALIARRPDALCLPQFWAEDGPVFFQPAFDGRGAAALLEPYAGYLHLFPRLVAWAWAATTAPPEYTPLVFNATALLVAGVCVWLFTLPLGRALLPSDGLRLALALLFVLANPAVETYGNLTNLHWWMALGSVVVLSVPLAGRWIVPLACGLVGLTALSAPLTFLFVPVALLTALCGGSRYRAVGLTLLLGVALQGCARLLLAGEEPALPSGRTVGEITRFTLDAGYATLVQLVPGYRVATELEDHHRVIGLVSAGLLFALLVGRALWPWRRRQAVLVVGDVYLLASASVLAVLTRWHTWPSLYLLRTPIPYGGRYAFLPYAACVFLLGLAVQQGLGAPAWRARLAVSVLFVTAAVCGVGNRPPMVEFADLEWGKRVRQAREQRGATIPINPKGWTVELRTAPP
jgi:hypothetical protein